MRANEVYQEYIKDKNHYHMNATRVSHTLLDGVTRALCILYISPTVLFSFQWETLTGFVMFLGKTGMLHTFGFYVHVRVCLKNCENLTFESGTRICVHCIQYR